MKSLILVLVVCTLNLTGSAQAADRYYSCDVLSGGHSGYRVNVIKSSSGDMKINLLESMNTLVTYTVRNEQTCNGGGLCLRAESNKKIEGKTMEMNLAISTKNIQRNGKVGLRAKASFDSFDLRKPVGHQRLHDEGAALVCQKN